MTDVPILDKGIDDWGSDEQEEAYDRLQSLKQDCEGEPSKLYINEDGTNITKEDNNVHQ